MGPDGLIIAIDGPAGSGKSSTAKLLANEIGYRYMDSGSFYRAITWALQSAGVPAADWDMVDDERLDALGISGSPADDGFLLSAHGRPLVDELRTAQVTANVSTVATLPRIRAWVNRPVREAGARGGLVADGRDIGTVVFPDADLKIFLVADPSERARRRLLEEGSRTDEAEVKAEMARLMGRDSIDSTRQVAPLRQAEDAVLLDTTNLTLQGQVTRIREMAARLDPRLNPR